jgi:NitT/TauT family transport system ATP-binding protein
MSDNKAQEYLKDPVAPMVQAIKNAAVTHDNCENVIDLRKIVKEYKGRKGVKFLQPLHRMMDRMNVSPIGKIMMRFLKWTGFYGTIKSRALGKPDVRVLNGVDLLVPNKPEGEFVVVMGASGSGKSTLLRFMANLDKPTSGDVFINGLNVNNWLIRLGMVFQEYSSFPWLTVLDNVALGLKYQGVKKEERRARALEMIKRVGLEGHELKYAKKPGLSGGQLQRVAIARSLLANPQVLLLDEPFGALDVKTRAQMQDLLCSLFEEFKPTIVLVTHDIDEAVYLADDIFILSKPPAVIAHKIHVDLGYHRDRSIKRSEAFLNLKNKVEYSMMALVHR